MSTSVFEAIEPILRDETEAEPMDVDGEQNASRKDDRLVHSQPSMLPELMMFQKARYHRWSGGKPLRFDQSEGSERERANAGHHPYFGYFCGATQPFVDGLAQYLCWPQAATRAAQRCRGRGLPQIRHAGPFEAAALLMRPSNRSIAADESGCDSSAGEGVSVVGF